MDTSFKTPDGGRIFEDDYTARAMAKLAQKNVRKILRFQYDVLVARNDYTVGPDGHSVTEICAATGLSEDF